MFTAIATVKNHKINGNDYFESIKTVNTISVKRKKIVSTISNTYS